MSAAVGLALSTCLSRRKVDNTRLCYVSTVNVSNNQFLFNCGSLSAPVLPLQLVLIMAGVCVRVIRTKWFIFFRTFDFGVKFLFKLSRRENEMYLNG